MLAAVTVLLPCADGRKWSVASLGDHAEGATWKDCSAPGSHGTVKNIVIKPAQPVKGQTFTVDGTGTVDEAITASTYTLKIALGGIPVFTHSGDGCKPDSINLPLGMGTVDLGGLKCPTAAGQTVSLHQSITVGKASPSGKFTATFSAVDQNKQSALCVEIDFTMSAEAEEQEELALQKPLKIRTVPQPNPVIVSVIGRDANGHYEDPLAGPCGSDEVNVTVTGIPGSFCSPKCELGIICPKDVPAGVTAKSECALQDSSSKAKYCALICTPSAADDTQCGTNASCKKVPNAAVGLCTYDK